MRWSAAGLTFALASFCVGGCARPSTEAAPPLASRPSTGQEVSAVAQNKVEVRFLPGSDRLSPDADRQLDLATRLFRDVNPVRMFAMGYSDASGDEWDNVLLSARRARAVKQGLVARGIPSDRVLIQAFGESEPADSRDPSDPVNRRVVVQWQIL